MHPNDLQTADILLSTGDALASAAIRIHTMSRYSHASLYIGGGQVIEAIGSGVTLQSVPQAVKDDRLVSVYRRLHITPGQANMVVRYARQQIGKDYDLSGALGSGARTAGGSMVGIFLSPIVAIGLAADLYNRANPEAAFFCSELVTLAFENAALPLDIGGASATPEDIRRSHVLNYVGDLKG